MLDFMIDFITGDLLDFPNGINVIIHCANCKNKMNSGIAKRVRERYPEVYKADTEAHKYLLNNLGNFSMAAMDENRAIYNLYGQKDYGYDGKRYLNYDGFYDGLGKIRDDLLTNSIMRGKQFIVGIPFGIGCVRAGGNWEVVQTMIKEVFKGSGIKVNIVSLPDDKKEVYKPKI